MGLDLRYNKLARVRGHGERITDGKGKLQSKPTASNHRGEGKEEIRANLQEGRKRIHMGKKAGNAKHTASL